MQMYLWTNKWKEPVPLSRYPQVNKKQINNYFIHALNYSIQDKMDSVLSEHDNINKNNHPFSIFSLVQYFAPHKKTFLPLIRGDFGYFWPNLWLILVNLDSFWLILAYLWGIMANFGQNHLNSHAKSNLPGYL